MSDFLDVDISGILADTFQGKVESAILRKYTAGIRTSTSLAGGTNPTSEDFAAEGFVDRYKDHHIDGTTIQKSDRKILLFGDLIEKLAVPEPGDEIIIEGTTFRIQENGVNRDPAKATYTCHGRSA